MNTLQFSLFFVALVVGYLLVHFRLVRFEAYLRQISELKKLNERLQSMAESMGRIRVDRLQEGLQQLHEDLRELGEVGLQIDRNLGQARQAQAEANSSPAATVERIRSAIEERLQHLGYNNIKLVTDLAGHNLEDEIEITVECEKHNMPCKGKVTTLNGAISDVSVHTAAKSFP